MMRPMRSRLIFVGCTLTLLAGCSMLVATDGLTDDVTVDAGPDSGADAPGVQGATDASPDDPDALVDAAVPDGQTRWPVNGHRYEVRIFATAKSWTEARDEAAASGGYLVTITSAEEAAFVGSLVFGRRDAFSGSNGPWIGAHQPKPESSPEPAGGWAWVTGEPWSHVSWRPSEPNDYGKDEHWAHFSDKGGERGWNDIDLTSANIKSAVVEYD